MNKVLAYGYVLCVATLVAMTALARNILPQLNGITTFFYMNVVGLLLLPAAFLCFKGARLSSGRLRKFLAYGTSIVAAFLGIDSVIAAISILMGTTRLG